MKRIGLIVLSVLLVWSMLRIPAVADPAETPEPQLEVRFSQESAVRGETITADIILHNNPGIAAINFHIGHDAKLKLTEYAGSQLTDWVVGVNGGENAVWVNSKTFTGDGSILKLVFQVSEAIPNTADVKLTVSAEGLKAYDLNENEVYFTVKPATISVKPVACEENAHVWDSGKTTVFPSYSMPGEKTFTCTVCGSHKTEATPKLQKHCIHACATCGGCTGKTLCEGFKPCTCQDSDGAPETKPVEGCSVIISISVDLVLKVNKIENAPKVTESIENAVNNLNDKTNASSEPGDNLQLGEITAVYDVMLQDAEGNEYEPKEEINVTVTLQVGKDNASALEMGTMVLVHFGKNGDVIYGVNKQGTETLTVNKNEGTATFTTDGFSPFALLKVSEHEETGVVSGIITSYGSASEAVTVTLLQGTSVIGSPQVLTGASGSVPYSQNYSFPAVPAGEYTLKVVKTGHAPWTENITVDSSNVTKDVTVYLWGDVNRDGKVTAADAQEIQRKAAGLSSVFDTDPNSAYCMLRADVNRDGGITAADAQEIQRKAAGLSSTISTLP